MISGLILAAGTSSRLGRPKQLLELGGKPALQYAIECAAAAGMDEIVVILGHEATRIRAAIHLPPFGRAVVNADYETGQGSSLRAGIDAIHQDAEAAVILLGDQPQLDPQVVGEVVAAWRAGDAKVSRAIYRGGVPGHPVVVGRPAFEAFRDASGDDGGRSVLASLAVAEVRVDADAPADLDTWDQYEALRRAF